MSVPEANAPSQSWTTLLQNYISKGKQKPMKEQEEETTQLFMDILDEDAIEDVFIFDELDKM